VKKTLHWIASNVALAILSLTLATLAWVVAVETNDPTREERYSQPISVTPSQLPAGMTIVGDFNEQVEVTIRAPKSVWEILEPDDFTAKIDLTGLSTGVYTIPVQAVLNKNPAQVVLVEPENISLYLEPRAERNLPVHVQVNGDPSLGYIMRAPIIAPHEVAVSGPSSYVTQVTAVVTQLSAEGASADIEKELSLYPQDIDGKSVQYVTLTPNKADVRIPIRQSGHYRSLAVKVNLEGNIAPGYFNSSISIEPPTITVFGSPDVIDSLPGFIETEPIDVEDAQADIIVQPALNVPPGVAIVSGQQVEVNIPIKPIQSSSTVEAAPEFQGLEPGLTATISLDAVEVILVGPLALLENLKTSDVRVVLDMFGLPRGTHQVEPGVVAPEGVTAQSIIPNSIQVKISSILTPTPSSDQ